MGVPSPAEREVDPSRADRRSPRRTSFAVGHQPRPTLDAAAAECGGEHDVIAGTDDGDRSADLFDDSGALVAEDGG